MCVLGGISSLRRTLGRKVAGRKFPFPSTGPPRNNSRRSQGGAPPGPLLWDAWPGFPHLGVARVVGITFGPYCSGERNFLPCNVSGDPGRLRRRCRRVPGQGRQAEADSLRFSLNLYRLFPRSSPYRGQIKGYRWNSEVTS